MFSSVHFLRKACIVFCFFACGHSQNILANSAPFAVIERYLGDDIFFKDSRMFIFSKVNTDTPLRIRDTLLVGAASKATLRISDEFGGGVIELNSNSIVTMVYTGDKVQVPTINLVRGELKVIQSPGPVKDPNENQSDSNLRNRAGNKVKLHSKNILIASKDRAILFNTDLSGALLQANEDPKAKNPFRIVKTLKSPEAPTSSEKPTGNPTQATESAPINQKPEDQWVELDEVEKAFRGTPVVAKPVPVAAPILDVKSTSVAKSESRGIVKAKDLMTKSLASSIGDDVSDLENDVVIPPRVAPMRAPKFKRKPSSEMVAGGKKGQFSYSSQALAVIRSQRYLGESQNLLDFEIAGRAELPWTSRMTAAASAQLTLMNLSNSLAGTKRPYRYHFEIENRLRLSGKRLKYDPFSMVGGFSYTMFQYESLKSRLTGVIGGLDFYHPITGNLWMGWQGRLKFFSLQSASISLGTVIHWRPDMAAVLAYCTDTLAVQATERSIGTHLTLGLQYKF